MSSRSSSLLLSSPSNSSIDSSERSQRAGSNEVDLQAAAEPPRPTREDYQTYTALVRDIDKGDNLIAKRIIASREQLRQNQVPSDGQEVQGNSPQVSSSTWPLQLADLPSSDPCSLEDSILAFASAYIRENKLVLPRKQDQINENAAGLEDLDEIIPDFLPAMMETADQLLDNLAVMRPAGTRKMRTKLKPMDWRSILSAGMIGGSLLDEDVLLHTNRKVRDLLSIEGEDVLTHRLRVLKRHDPAGQGKEAEQPRPKTRPRDVHRPHHLSQQEREKRAIKREQRAAVKLEREQAKAASLQSPTKATKKRLRRQRKAKPDYDG